jgi:hypothetical protein
LGTGRSGKTALCQLLKAYILEQEGDTQVITQRSWARADEDPIGGFLTCRFPNIWTPTASKTVLIIDGAHHTYHDQIVWDQFRYIRDNKDATRVVLLARYGNPYGYLENRITPIPLSPEQQIFLKPEETAGGSSAVGLLIAEEEIPFVIKKTFDENHFDDSLIKWAFEVSAGLLGVFIWILKFVESQDVCQDHYSVSNIPT